MENEQKYIYYFDIGFSRNKEVRIIKHEIEKETPKLYFIKSRFSSTRVKKEEVGHISKSPTGYISMWSLSPDINGFVQGLIQIEKNKAVELDARIEDLKKRKEEYLNNAAFFADICQKSEETGLTLEKCGLTLKKDNF